MRLLLLLFSVIASLHTDAEEKLPAEKILQVTVDETGTISVGRDTVGSDNLARYIQQRLFKSYLGTGKMHSKIKFSKANANVPDIVIQVVLKEIREGQRRALSELCIQKYKSLFDNIDKRKQEKLKKQFPVLFQADYR